MLWNRILLNCGSEQCNWRSLLKLGILVVTFLFNCDTCSAQDTSSKSSTVKQSSHHSKWSSSEKSILPWDNEARMPNIVPLTLKEHENRESKALKKSRHSSSSKTSNKKLQSSKRDEDSRGKGNAESRTNDKYNSDGQDAEMKVDLAMLRRQALDFGSLVVSFLIKEMRLPADSAGESRGARGIMSDLANTFKLERKEGGSEGGGGGDKGVIDWLARLVGVQGKTLGEFLREYQVHVLYDLVFTFFKWIFFLYAGLLIP